MANSRYEYVRAFEQPDSLLPNTFIVVRIDGRGFTKLTTKYKFAKPNDRRALLLMNAAAEAVMKDLPDLVLAYGQSDEFSFVFHKDCLLFERRASKLTTTVVSTFTANYVLGWSTYFPDTPLTAPLPSFDGRAVCYPSDINLRDYLSWRQVDYLECHDDDLPMLMTTGHINNLYNTSFWALVQQGGMDHRAAEQELSGTLSADKNEILFSRFGINYNNEPEIFKKGSVLYRDFFPATTQPSPPEVPKIQQSQTPPLSQPKPKRIARPMSQPLERSRYTDLLRDSPSNETSSSTTPRGPTFLSTSTTPSPPPSPPSLSIPTVANPLPEASNPLSEANTTFYPQTFDPVSPPAHITNAMRQPLPQLTPIPLPPLTLKPSTRPPPSLNPPNPTSYKSPLPSPSATRNEPGFMPATRTIPQRTTSNSKRPPRAPSHSAQASLSAPRPLNSASTKPSPKRSPSMSALDFGPPQIPLRISSIPINAPPRKLSLPSQKSYSMLRAEEKENLQVHTSQSFATHNGIPTAPAYRKPTPPHLKTMKELPSPPVDDFATRHAVMGSEPPKWSTSPTPTRQSDIDRFITNPVIPTSSSPPIPPRNRPRGCSHSRLNSAPPTTTVFTALGSHPPAQSKPEPTPYKRTNAALYDQEREARERDDRIRFAHFDWSPTLLSPTSPDHLSSPNDATTSSAANADIAPHALPPPFTRSKSTPSIHADLDFPMPPPLPPKPTSTSMSGGTAAAPSTGPPPPLQPRRKDPSSHTKQPLSAAAKPKNPTSSKPAPPAKAAKSTTTTTTNPGLSEDGSWKAAAATSGAGGGGGRPVQQSRTQRERERKKRVKAKIVVEHVDLIKDGFWERRPWILSGRVG